MTKGRNTYSNQNLDDLKSLLRKSYPDLQVFTRNNRPLIRGSFPVQHEGNILDRYLIEVEVPANLSKEVPIVREIGGRIPRLADRHVNMDGTACISVPEEWLLSSGHENLLNFLNGPVRDFFLGQSLVERGKKWPYGDRSHGFAGLIEAYGEMFNTEDPEKIRRYLEFLSRKGFKGHWICPCGTANKVRDCHMDRMQKLRRQIPPHVASSAFDRFKSLKKIAKP
jgi:hypothetical protein